MNKPALLILATLVGTARSPLAQAGEGGRSLYLQGAYGDWVVSVPSPAGIYLREDIFLYGAGFGLRPMGGTALSATENGAK